MPASAPGRCRSASTTSARSSEKPQKGRYRQFHQIGAEVVGDEGPLVDAELITMLMRFLEELGHDDLEVLVNTVGDVESRQAFREALAAYLEPRRDALSADSRRRLKTNPLRILDSKSERDAEVLDGAPRLEEHLSPGSREHFEAVVTALEGQGVAVSRRESLVRGLDYYTRTVFEIVSAELGAQDALVGGGRYDDLVAELGGPEIPAIGFAIGQDRLIETLPDDSPSGVSGADRSRERYRGSPPGRGAARRGARDPARQSGARCRQVAQARRPVRHRAGGEREATLKNLTSGEQVTVPRGELGGRLATAVDVSSGAEERS